MIENILLKLLILSLYGNIVVGIIAIVLLVILTNNALKNNHSSANQ